MRFNSWNYGKKILLFCTIVLIFGTMGLYAKEFKIGYVEVEKVYEQLPEKVEAEAQFNQEVDEWQRELDQLQAEIERLRNEYDNLPPIVSEDRKEEKLALIEKKEREYYELASNLRYRAMQRQQELLQPISEKIITAINEVAEENDFDLILNAYTLQGEIVLYAKEGLDITDLVMEKISKASEKK
jgi:outer membrane protein